MSKYNSIFAPFIADYIAFKQNLGYAFKEESSFRAFDKFATEERLSVPALNQSQCEKWNDARPMESPKTRANRLNDIRNFLTHQNHIGYNTYVPRPVKTEQSEFTPYIYSQDEISRFF